MMSHIAADFRSPSTTKEAWPKEMRIRQVSLSDRKSSQVRLPSIDNTRDFPQAARKVTHKKTEANQGDLRPQNETRQSIRDSDPKVSMAKKRSVGGLLIKDNKRPSQVHRELRTKQAAMDPGDRAELFYMQSKKPNWRSHWTGPL